MTTSYAPVPSTTATPLPPAAVAPMRSTNGFAVTAFVLSLVGWTVGLLFPILIVPVVVLAIVFGLVALRQIKRRNENGRAMAIASLWLTAVQILLCVAIITVVIVW